MNRPAARNYFALTIALAALCLAAFLSVDTAKMVAAAPLHTSKGAQATPSQVGNGHMKGPDSASIGMPTGGWVTTLFVEPISYENSGYYYDADNQIQFADYVFHHGIDVSGGCTAGTYPIYAGAGGTVALAQYVNDGYGTQVVLDNGYNIGGNGKYTYTFYSHMGSRTTGARYLVVSPGQVVQAGQLLGYQGNDGSAFGSCGPDPGTHLDWEVRVTSTALTYGSSMRYNATAASPDFYTLQQVSYSDVSPLSTVVAGPFNGGGIPPSATPRPPNTPVPPSSTPRPSNTPTTRPTSTPISAPTQTPGPCGMSFSDVQDDYWAYSSIAYLYCHNAISGFADGTFRPTSTTTRGQFTKMLVLGFGWTLYNPYFPSFSDVPTNSPFYQYIETAHLRNVISGYTDGTFHTNDSISRAQTAKMLVLAEGWETAYPVPPTFSDVSPSHWAYGYIEVAARNGLISGYSDGTFHPERDTNRAQLSKMLSQAMQR